VVAHQSPRVSTPSAGPRSRPVAAHMRRTEIAVAIVGMVEVPRLPWTNRLSAAGAEDFARGNARNPRGPRLLMFPAIAPRSRRLRGSMQQ
jgi:hypothetical protein